MWAARGSREEWGGELGRPGEREREEEADRAGLGRAAGPAQKVGPRGGKWVWAGKLGFAFSISIPNSNKG